MRKWLCPPQKHERVLLMNLKVIHILHKHLSGQTTICFRWNYVTKIITFLYNSWNATSRIGRIWSNFFINVKFMYDFLSSELVTRPQGLCARFFQAWILMLDFGLKPITYYVALMIHIEAQLNLGHSGWSKTFRLFLLWRDTKRGPVCSPDAITTQMRTHCTDILHDFLLLWWCCIRVPQLPPLLSWCSTSDWL